MKNKIIIITSSIILGIVLTYIFSYIITNVKEEDSSFERAVKAIETIAEEEKKQTRFLMEERFCEKGVVKND